MGSITFTVLPALILSGNQLDINPPSTRFIVTDRSESLTGDELSEYALRTSLPPTVAIRVRN